MSVSILPAIAWAASLAALTASATADVRTRIIPDGFAILIAACGAALSLRAGAAQAFIGMLAALAVFFALGVLAHYNAIGGGDVKLISAATLLVAPDRVPLLLLEISLAGGALSCLYLASGLALRRWPLIYRGAGRRAGEYAWLRREARRIARGYPMPYALAVLGGVTIHLMTELPQ